MARTTMARAVMTMSLAVMTMARAAMMIACAVTLKPRPAITMARAAMTLVRDGRLGGQVVAKALSKKVGSRYQSAAEMRQALFQVYQGL